MKSRAAIAASLLLSCVGADEPGPRLLGVTPSQGEDAASIPVEIAGDNFRPRAITDFSHAGQSALRSGFQAFLVPADPGQSEVALAEVALAGTQTLTAVVPPGIARGFYGMRVIDPFGRTATLPEVYRAVRSAGELAAFRIEAVGPQRAGVPFWLDVTAVDAGGGTVDGFSGAVTLADGTGSVAPASLSPFALGHARAQVAVASVAAVDALDVRDGAGHVGRSNDFAVLPGLAVQVAFATAPQAVDAGRCSARAELELRDAQDRYAVAEKDIAVALEAAPPQRVAFFSDAGCSQKAAARFAAGTPRAGFYFRAEVAGELAIRALPDGLPSATQAQAVRALAPVRLEFATPSPALAAGQCSGALALRAADALGNPSPPAASIAIDLASVPDGALRLFADPSCATPLSGAALDAADLSTFFARAELPGPSAIRATAPAPASLAPALLVVTVSP